MDILEALSHSKAIRHITTRHEQGAAFMADVHGRLTGRAAVAMATLGPGATNLVTGIADAYLDRAPMVAITGQVGSDKLHKEAHQFVDIIRMFEPVTKWNQRVERIDAIPEIVRKAFRVAELEKPGPTHIELPENRAQMPPEFGRPDTAARAPTDLSARTARRGSRARRRTLRRGREPAHPCRQRRAAASCELCPARLRQRGPRAGRDDVHGQGRDRRPRRAVADGRRVAGARPRADRLRSRRPRRERGLRPGRVRAGTLEPRSHDGDHPHRHAARRGRRRLPPGGRARRRHRRQPAPAARAASALAARARPSGWSTTTSARSCCASWMPIATTPAGRSSPRRRSPTCVARWSPTTSS